MDETSWLAGLLEGEGCLRVTRQGPRSWGSAWLALAMTDKDVVERAAAMMGAKSISAHVGKGHYKTMYQAVISGKKAIGVMQRVLPYMGERRTCAIRDAIDHEADKPRPEGQTPSNSAKLSIAAVLDIRTSAERGGQIAKRYGVSPSTVSMIRKRKIWAHI